MGWIIAGVVVAVFIIFVIIGNLIDPSGAQQSAGKIVPAGKGKLMAKGVTLAYFADGVVYDRNMVNIGAYKPGGTMGEGGYSFIFDDKIVGYYSITGDDIRVWRQGNKPYDIDIVAEMYSGASSIIPKDDNYEVALCTGDPAGAAAAYIILCYEFTKFSTEYMQYFMK